MLIKTKDLPSSGRYYGFKSIKIREVKPIIIDLWFKISKN